jgi:hypothetical protein
VPDRREQVLNQVSGLFAGATVELMRRATTSRLYFARERDGDGGEDEYRGDHRKGVAEAHHQRLAFYGIAERGDRLLMRRRRIRHAMGHEGVGHPRNSVAPLLETRPLTVTISILRSAAVLTL